MKRRLYKEGGNRGGIKKYVRRLEDITYDADNMKFYEKATGKELGDSAILDELIVNGRNKTNDYLTEANDNTSVYNVQHRKYNQHLKDRAERGAISNALWEREHPNMTSWRNLAESVPFAVAAAPAVMAGGETLASTALGQGVTSGLNFLAGAAKASPIVSTALSYADAGLTSIFGAHGASEIAKGNVNPKTLMEVAPLGQLAKPIVNAGHTGYNTAKSFVNLAKVNRGFAVSTPYMGRVLGRTTAWVPFDRPLTKGVSWMATGKPIEEGLPIEYITSKYPGEARKLYDAGINIAHKQGSRGLLVGDILLSAPKSYSTYEHYYPNRILVDNRGFWTNRNMLSNPNIKGRSVYSLDDFLKETKEHPEEQILFSGAPRYRLEKPSTVEITSKNKYSKNK